MSDYDFILDSMAFSYSSASNFNQCPKQFYLTYIDCKERKQNFFSQYGLLCHEILEKYFGNELDFFDLADYYKENYYSQITLPPPPYPAGMADKYYEEGLTFFENFTFNKNDYDVIAIEDSYRLKYMDFNVVVKPDLILQRKSDKKYILFDYKTSKLKYNKYDEQKMEGYRKQFYLYAYFTLLATGIQVDEIKVWFIRNNDIVDIPVNPIAIGDTVDWFKSTISQIKEEEDWTAKPSDYFCNFLCSVSEFCDIHQEKS